MREIKKGDKVKIVYGKYVGQTGTVINIEESDENNKSGGRMNKKKPCDCKVCEATEEWFKKRTILEYEAYKKGKEIMSEEKVDIGSEIGQVLADFDQDHDAIKASRNVIQTVYDFRDQSLSDYKSLLRKWVEDDADIYTKEMGENATRTNLIKLDDLLAFIEKGE